MRVNAPAILRHFHVYAVECFVVGLVVARSPRIAFKSVTPFLIPINLLNRPDYLIEYFAKFTILKIDQKRANLSEMQGRKTTGLKRLLNGSGVAW